MCYSCYSPLITLHSAMLRPFCAPTQTASLSVPRGPHPQTSEDSHHEPWTGRCHRCSVQRCDPGVPHCGGLWGCLWRTESQEVPRPHVAETLEWGFQTKNTLMFLGFFHSSCRCVIVSLLPSTSVCSVFKLSKGWQSVFLSDMTKECKYCTVYSVNSEVRINQ